MKLYPVKKERSLLLFRHGKLVAVLSCTMVGISYLLACILSSSVMAEFPQSPTYNETYFVYLFVSIFLSLILLFQKTSYGAAVILLFRCYLIVIQGYAHGGFLSVKLILGMGILLESGIFLESPVNIVFSVLQTAGLLLAQLYSPIWGHHQYVEQEVFGSWDVIITMAFVFGCFTTIVNIMVYKSDKREEMWRSLRLQKESMKALAEFNSDLQAYAKDIDIVSSVRERNRISREIHDISGYIFTNLIALLNAACSVPPDDKTSLSDILITARKQAQEGLRETRIALRKIRDVKTPEEKGLLAINKIIKIFQKVSCIKVFVHWGNAPLSFSREIDYALYRTVQEALTNAIQHGLATEITIYFMVQNSILRMVIADNGQGSEKVVKGIGLTGMEERIGHLGGNISIHNSPGGGFTLAVEVPLGDDKKEEPEGKGAACNSENA